MRFVFHPAVKRQRHVTKTIQKLKRPVTKTIKGQKLRTRRPATKTIQSQKSKRLAFKTILGPKAKCQTVLFLPRPNGAVLSDTGRKVKWPFLLFLDLTITGSQSPLLLTCHKPGEESGDKVRSKTTSYYQTRYWKPL